MHQIESAGQRNYRLAEDHEEDKAYRRNFYHPALLELP
jgi:hypothetical protein